MNYNIRFDGVPDDCWGVSGTIICCEALALRDGVRASEEACEDGVLDGVDILMQL